MSTSMKGEMRPAIYRFRLGSFEVATILDSKIIREGLTPSHGGEALAGEVRALALATRIDPVRYEYSFIPSLVNTGRELVLFDTGNRATISFPTPPLPRPLPRFSFCLFLARPPI